MKTAIRFANSFRLTDGLMMVLNEFDGDEFD